MSLCPILCFVLICFGAASVSAQTCQNNGGFTPNGTYDANRRLILSSLPSNVTAQKGLFYNGSIGQEPNRVYVTGMCMPGSDPVDCSGCIKTASDGLLERCPNQTEAYSWPGDPTLCHVRYSNTSFLGSLGLSPRASITNGANVTSDLEEFRKIWEDLVVRMVDAASSNDSHYTANTAALTPFQDIYAMMQCTLDLSSDDCKTCLRRSASEYSQPCCNTKQGTRIVRPSCYFRMELYMFSKASFVNFTAASPPPVAVPHPPDGQANTTNNGKFSN